MDLVEINYNTRNNWIYEGIEIILKPIQHTMLYGQTIHLYESVTIDAKENQ